MLNESLNLEGSRVHRRAARGVIPRGDTYLLLFSPVNGDYKFPGGGVDPGEGLEEALGREVLEECGYRISGIQEKIAILREFDVAREEGIDYFQMDSHYYRCSVDPDSRIGQKLDPYEAELDFTPVWTSLDSAISANRAIIEGKRRRPRWTLRETLFLEYLAAGDV